MTYAIIGSGTVGSTLARFFAAKKAPVSIANSRGPETLAALAAELGPDVTPVPVEAAVEADVILFAVGSVAFKDVGALREDWSGKIVVDVTNGFMLPPEVQEAEFHGRLTSEVNAERVPGAKLVKTFNQVPLKVLAGPVPDGAGCRVVFVSSDHEDASAAVAKLVDELGHGGARGGQAGRRRPPDLGARAAHVPEPDQIPDVDREPSKMRFGFIGAGKVARTIARHMLAAGHRPVRDLVARPRNAVTARSVVLERHGRNIPAWPGSRYPASLHQRASAQFGCIAASA